MPNPKQVKDDNDDHQLSVPTTALSLTIVSNLGGELYYTREYQIIQLHRRSHRYRYYQLRHCRTPQYSTATIIIIIKVEVTEVDTQHDKVIQVSSSTTDLAALYSREYHYSYSILRLEPL